MADVAAVDKTHSPLPPQPQLFLLESIDIADPWQYELVECYQTLASFVTGKSQIEIHDALQQK
ncbi:hypothetical protein IWW36_005944, partial [Coemansia brasiliensis]